MKPETRAEAAAWLAKADIDLRAARADLAAIPPISSDALFHCQQAIEKALKGILAAHEIPAVRKHDLEQLGKLVIMVEPSLCELVPRSYHLSIYASEFRYPGEMGEPDVATVNAGLEEAVAIVQKINGAIERLP
jgi:HEPN domain-containing protein